MDNFCKALQNMKAYYKENSNEKVRLIPAESHIWGYELISEEDGEVLVWYPNVEEFIDIWG